MKKIYFLLITLISIVCFLPPLSTGQLLSFGNSLCLDEFYAEAPPELINKKLSVDSYPLCNQGFTIHYSGISKTPIWVAEKLSPERLSIRIKREDNFHEDDRLPVSAQATLEAYRNSGYDRGHMAPNADMNNKTSQYQSFALSNIIPQHYDNNQNTWREIEEATRAMVTKYKLDAYIVTGSVYLEPTVKYVKKGHDVLVPSHVYKAVYFPRIGMASAYLSKNDGSRYAETISICALEEKVGISLYPRLDEQSKRQIFQLPMRANQVKANKHPSFVNNDLQSQCAPMVEAEQISATQKRFVVGQSYALENPVQWTTKEKVSMSSLPNLIEMFSTTNEDEVQKDALENSEMKNLKNEGNERDEPNRFSINRILLPIVEWMKEKDTNAN